MNPGNGNPQPSRYDRGWMTTRHLGVEEFVLTSTFYRMSFAGLVRRRNRLVTGADLSTIALTLVVNNDSTHIANRGVDWTRHDSNLMRRYPRSPRLGLCFRLKSRSDILAFRKNHPTPRSSRSRPPSAVNKYHHPARAYQTRLLPPDGFERFQG